MARTYRFDKDEARDRQRVRSMRKQNKQLRKVRRLARALQDVNDSWMESTLEREVV